MNGHPSWAAPGGAARRVTPGPGRPPATLVAAVAGVVALAAVETVQVAGRDDLRAPLRAVLVAGIALQVPCAALALRRSSAAVMVLLLCGVTALIASVAAGELLAALAAGAVLVLIGSSLRWFPTAEPWSS